VEQCLSQHGAVVAHAEPAGAIRIEWILLVLPMQLGELGARRPIATLTGNLVVSYGGFEL
jgi:hypothetical protein